MSKAPKTPKRIQRLMKACRGGQTVCLTIRHSEVGDERNYWLEPSGKAVGEWTVQRAIDMGLLVPQRDGLFPDLSSQTFKAVPDAPVA